MSKLKRFDIFVDGEFHDQDNLLPRDDGEFADGEVAQELYDALDDLLDEYMSVLHSAYCQCDEDYQTTDKVKSALAKARGEL